MSSIIFQLYVDIWKFGFCQSVFHSITHWKQRTNTQAKLISSKVIEGYGSVASLAGLTWGSDELDFRSGRDGLQGVLNPPVVVRFQGGLWSRLGLEHEETKGAGVEMGCIAVDWKIYTLSFAMDTAGLTFLWGRWGVWLCFSGWMHGHTTSQWKWAQEALQGRPSCSLRITTIVKSSSPKWNYSLPILKKPGSLELTSVKSLWRSPPTTPMHPLSFTTCPLHSCLMSPRAPKKGGVARPRFSRCSGSFVEVSYFSR